MTRDEFETRFNALFNADNPPAMDVVAQFRQDALADYDNATASTTTINTLNTKITELTTENTNLRNTNYKLFQMNPAAFQFNNNQQPPNPQNPPQPPEEPTITIADIQAELF